MNKNDQLKKIRYLAEEKIKNSKGVLNELPSYDLHELRVHQIELEMQSEELMRSQEALSASRELYFNLYELAPIGYCSLNERGSITESNLATANLLGLDRCDLVGKLLSNFIFREDQDIYYLYSKKVLTTAQTQSCELRMIKLDGTHFWGRLEAIALKNVNGTTVIRIVISDVSSREQQLLLLIDDLKTAREQAENANRAKSLFLASMSHELRTPLNGVLGFAQLLELEDLSPKHKEYLKFILNSGKNLLTLIDDILDLSKVEAEKIELESIVINLHSIIEETILAHSLNGFKKNISLNKIFTSDLSEHYLGDPLRLKQILNNLISNAIKFTKVGNILISVKVISKNENLDVVQFVVSDEGIGMNQETLEIIFKPFVQASAGTSREYGGSGLGLAISKKLVELMGGQIKAESVFGKGSTFFFEIPLQKTCVGNSPMHIIQNRSVNPHFKNLSVLLVEDDLDILHLGITLLGFLGFQVKAVKRASEALELLEKENFDLLLTDIQMPGMSGVEMIKLIREKEKITKKHQRAIALTAYALKSDKEQFLEVGFDGYVSKPIDVDVLIHEMERVITAEH